MVRTKADSVPGSYRKGKTLIKENPLWTIFVLILEKATDGRAVWAIHYLQIHIISQNNLSNFKNDNIDRSIGENYVISQIRRGQEPPAKLGGAVFLVRPLIIIFRYVII